MSEEQDPFEPIVRATLAEAPIATYPVGLPKIPTFKVSLEQARAELRDRFATAALTGLLAYPDGSVGSPERFSATAYEYADAMLKARGDD